MKLPLSMLVLAAACGGSDKTTTTTTTTTTAPPEPVMVEEEPVSQPVTEEAEPPAVFIGQLTEAPPIQRLDKAAIRRVIRQNLPGVRQCYEAELLKQPGLQGTTTVTFTITPSGQVESAVGAGFDATVDLCVANFIATLTFPAASNPTQVNYPFKFQTDPGADPSKPAP